MGTADITFYAFAVTLLGAGFLVTISRNMVHSVLWLILCFLSAAGLFVLLGAEFMAMLLIIVYVGAVAVLFLFVVMMLDINLAKLKSGFASYLPVGLMVAMAMAAQLLILIWSRGSDSPVLEYGESGGSNTQVLGELLYTQYLYPFEIAGFILLVSIVAAISLTHRRRPETKYQNPSRQVKVRRDERVRLVKMDAEKED